MPLQPTPIRSRPGIKRDGTTFDSDYYMDGQWVRFQRGLPRKMYGYRNITSSLLEKIYGMDVFTANGMQFIHLGSESLLNQIELNSVGTFSSQTDRTPASGFVASPDNLWQFEHFYDGPSGKMSLVAHAGQNLTHIDNTTETNIFVGDITAGGVLTVSAMDAVSGGILALNPYLLAFGNDGRVDVSPINDPLSAPGDSAFITGSKIVRGLPLRGSGSGPSGLLWSLDSLIRATFTSSATADGGPNPIPFAFDTLSAQISILSSQSVIEYDGIFYWIAIDRWMMFNGVVQEIPNDMNKNFFFDNVNMAYRQKVFVFKVPRFGEIWWCFPKGDSTECNHAIVMQPATGTWYDTPLPTLGRSAAYFAQVYDKPFMTDLVLTGTGYSLWQHETGVDSVNGSTTDPIKSFFQTHENSLLTSQPAATDSLRCARIEPDFVQVGDMSVRVDGRSNARAPVIQGEVFTFPDVATNAAEQTVPIKETRRLMSFYFESNTPGGNYQMGNCIAHIEKGDGRITS
jgi:hypothetical protein